MSESVHPASQAHERVMFNLAIFHFLVPAILFATKNLWLIFGLSLLGSLLMIASIARKAHHAKDLSELEQAHWQLAWRRCRLLMLSYIIALAVFCLSWGLLQMQSDDNMRMIQLAVAGWFCLLPLSLTIIWLIIAETSALAQARKGIMPEQMKL